jgi:L-asparaginase II
MMSYAVVQTRSDLLPCQSLERVQIRPTRADAVGLAIDIAIGADRDAEASERAYLARLFAAQDYITDGDATLIHVIEVAD